jgi:FtsX-like permease family protein
VIRIGLRLSVNSGKEAVVRLVVTAAAVAIGVGLLLVTVAGVHAVHAQDVREAWLNTTAHNERPSVDETTSDPLWGTASLDEYRDRSIERVDVAATGPRSPVPPGIPSLPRPGEFYASPALTRLLATTPARLLGARYAGHQVGTIGPAALASPESLVIVIGHSAAELSHVPGAAEVRSFETAPQGTSGDRHPGRMQLILAVVAGALLFPVLIFIAAASRLAAARREQRFAAMRLVGATPRQVGAIASVEAAVAAIGGVAGGFALFLVLRSPMAAIPFTGQPFFPRDLSLHPLDIALVAVGVPILAALAARVALRRVQISPLGVSRRTTPPAPRAWRALPLLAGLSELAYFVGRRPGTTSGQVRAYGVGFLLAMGGLVIAGPWLTMLGARVTARRTNSPAGLIAGRRLADNPRAAFRAVSGLIVALFVSSSALGVITTILAYHSATTGGAAGRSILVEFFGPEDVKGQHGGDQVDVSPGVLRQVGSIGGVHAVTVLRAGAPAAPGPALGPSGGLVSCEQLARMPALGRCAPGASVASMPVYFSSGGVVAHKIAEGPVWPAASVSPDQLQTAPVMAVYVGTDGSTDAIEAARTTLEAAFPYLGSPSTIGEISADNAQLVAGWERLADVAIIGSLTIAACSLAVSVAAGLVERKRPFSLLRLAGTPLAVLRRVVTIEAAVPLVAVAVISVATGFVAADLFLRSQLSETLRLPGAGFYTIVAGGMAVALGIIVSTFPLLERITGPEVARNE